LVHSLCKASRDVPVAPFVDPGDESNGPAAVVNVSTTLLNPHNDLTISNAICCPVHGLVA
jgi:hypothetical protein